ncbi:hypothetical protein ACWJKU_00160 (plasmid) [Methylocaldum sp. MU1018]|jgi:hypothetical protein
MIKILHAERDMEAHELATSSWGKHDAEVDVRALRRYQAILSRIASVGEVLVFVLLVGILAGAVWLFTQTNFENVIFYDGTDMTCVFNGKTGEIINVQ